MEKSRSEILAEIKDALESLKAQVADLESRITAFEADPAEEATEESPVEEVDMGPIDISLDDEDFVSEVPVEKVPEAAVPEVKEPEVKEPEIKEPEAKEPEAKEPEAKEELLEDILSGTPKKSINDKQEKVSRKAVMDVMSEKCAWRTAMPGTPVKNIISAISLNDRVLFINTLFKEDPMAFQDAISTLNAMSSFAEAEAYIRENHPDWNLNSDIVYRMMMAIRRKLK